MSEPRTLNLDEVTGRSRPVVIIRNGKCYEMVGPEGLTLKQNQQFNAMAKKLEYRYSSTIGFNQFKSQSEDQQINEILHDINDCLIFICPAILEEEKPLSLFEKISGRRGIQRKPWSFEDKINALEFYVQESFPKGKKDTKEKKAAGARRSHG